jgi:hypothetical protein
MKSSGHGCRISPTWRDESTVNENKRYLTALREAQCREVATKVLQRFHIETPEAIDLETIAWHVGRLKIKEGGLEGAEGRIVASSGHSGTNTIRVAPKRNEGRYRFTIAHEIGHYVLHPRDNLEKTDTREHFTIWNEAGEEAEANLFAAELLMPEFLFKPQCRGKEPSLGLVDSLAEKFHTSTLATAIQYWKYTNEQVALVLSKGWDMKSFSSFAGSWPRIRYGRIHEHSAAGERLAGKAGDSCKMVRTPAYAWLEGFEDDDPHDIMEDSRYLDWYERTISLLWLTFDLEEGD